MSLLKFPIFTVLNVADILLFTTALLFCIFRWKGFLKESPSSGLIVDALYGSCGFMIGIGIVGILITVTRSKFGIYLYKFLLFIAFILASCFIALVLMMHSGVANFVLQFSWSLVPDSKICNFQSEFGCAGWGSTCIPNQSVDGCPSCTFPPSDLNTTVTTKVPLPTCKSLFQHLFNDQFEWLMIGAGCFIVWVISLNIAAYCAGQQFTFFVIDDDEAFLLRREELRRERQRLLLNDQLQQERLHSPTNSLPLSEAPMKNMRYARV